MRILVVIVALAGCAPEEPSWQEGELGEWQPGLNVGAAGGCSTFIVDGLSQQLIAEQNCIRSGALVSFQGAANLSLGASVYPFLEQKAHDALVAAAKSYGTISVNSAFRTLAQQYLLYRWYQNGQCGISLAATPGNSNHETGIAVDVSNYSGALGALKAKGFTHSYPSSDPVHFDYTGGGTLDLRAESVLAFQKLWNLNNPNDMIAEDGAYGPQTGARVAESPADGFAKGSTCAPQSTPAPSSPPSTPPAPSSPPDPPANPDPPTNPPATPDFAAEFVAGGGPTTLAPAHSATVWLEFRNTGAHAWSTASTFLGTSGPHDRMSQLASPDWVSPNRPAAVDHDTAPGEVGRFSFTIVAPRQAAGFSESFGLVEGDVTWFPGVDYALELEVSGSGDTSSGCTVGGARDLSSLLTIVMVGLLYGRRRRRDVP